jgi:DNA polymerase-3 subunit gamma/tau
MSYLVLARKWRPKRFAELVGQEHVVRALTNALETGRVHHAFLFTGTRGVGKTTIARIFAKSLNCERGSSADPCGQCPACLDIDAGRYVDLLEIDAASNTGVDDVRALIENAQYMPARGRTKVYLIDEVHMLSKSAFNALLKTLEEPPGHVKFLLATTDPQKLPVTVLSRCLQFNLRRLEVEQIAGQMTRILEAEGIAAEPAAIGLLARAADGSLRDGLSLLDQALAYSGGRLDEAAVNAMLGTVDRGQVGGLLAALADGDGVALMQGIDELARFSPDFGQVLDDLAIALHRIQVRQLVPGSAGDDLEAGAAALAEALRPELVQLWYQMAVGGRRDIGYAPSPRTGFEMALLRMLAFRPVEPGKESAALAVTAPAQARLPASPMASTSPAVATPIDRAVREPGPVAAAPTPVSPAAAPRHAPEPAEAALLESAADWLRLVDGLGLKGPVQQLAAHAAFIAYEGGNLRLQLPDTMAHLCSEGLLRQLAQALSTPLGALPRIRIETPADAHVGAQPETLHARGERQRSERQNAAEAAFRADPVVSRLLAQGASVVADSVRPQE